MTRLEARRQSLPPGYAVRLNSERGLVIYLANDWRQGRTADPLEALYFGTLQTASLSAAAMTCNSGELWVVTTVPDPRWCDEQVDRIAYQLAHEKVFGSDMDDDDADITAASLAYPGTRPTVAGVEVK